MDINTKDMIDRRRNILGVMGTSPIDWENIARGMLGDSNSTLFSIPDDMPLEASAYLFYLRTNLVSLKLKDNITIIDSGCFYRCSNLGSISIPSTVTVISTTAFNDCVSLTEVQLPSSLLTLGNQTFRGCTGLTSITIPSLVNKIDAMCFYGCGNIRTMVCEPTTPPTLGNSALPPNATIYVPDASVNAYKAANNWSAAASRIHPISELGGGS